MSPKRSGPPGAPEGPVLRYRFRVRTATAKEVISPIATVHLPEAADHTYRVASILVDIHGQRQGGFKGEAPAPHATQFEALELSYEVNSPRDRASGQASGTRVHKPVTITRAWGPASPQIFQACVTNEVLLKVQFDCYGSDETTPNVLVHTVLLTNATVGQAKYRTDPRWGYVEDVSFSFEKIGISSPVTKLSVDDRSLA